MKECCTFSKHTLKSLLQYVLLCATHSVGVLFVLARTILSLLWAEMTHFLCWCIHYSWQATFPPTLELLYTRDMARKFTVLKCSLLEKYEWVFTCCIYGCLCINIVLLNHLRHAVCVSPSANSFSADHKLRLALNHSINCSIKDIQINECEFELRQGSFESNDFFKGHQAEVKFPFCFILLTFLRPATFLYLSAITTYFIKLSFFFSSAELISSLIQWHMHFIKCIRWAFCNCRRGSEMPINLP